MTLIEFTFDGTGATTASKAFTLKHSYKFNTVRPPIFKVSRKAPAQSVTVPTAAAASAPPASPR
jgi:hypothetical protein